MILHEMLLEMQTWFSIPAHLLEKAKAIEPSPRECERILFLRKQWSKGHFDEDPQVLKNELCEIAQSLGP